MRERSIYHGNHLFDAGVHHMDEQKVMAPLNIEKLFKAWAEIKEGGKNNVGSRVAGVSRICGVVSDKRSPGSGGGAS